MMPVISAGNIAEASMPCSRQDAMQLLRDAVKEGRMASEEKNQLLHLVAKLPLKWGTPELFEDLEMDEIVDVLKIEARSRTYKHGEKQIKA